MKVAYIRVSTQEQRPDRQIDGLRELADELHIETLSAVCRSRPVYEAALAKLRPGDTFVVWSLDRAYRSTVDAILEVEALMGRGVAFQMVQLPLDTSTPDGMLIYTVIAAFATYERQVISRRTKEGLAAARRRGKRIGRPPKVTPDDLVRVERELVAGHASIAELAAEIGVAPWTLTRARRRNAQHTEADAHSRIDMVDGRAPPSNGCS
jgi:DNA invertase Pin-like site-specific DNA recombinase